MDWCLEAEIDHLRKMTGKGLNFFLCVMASRLEFHLVVI